MTDGARVRSRSSLIDDLLIIVLGIWGFFGQCWRSLAVRGRAKELESGD